MVLSGHLDAQAVLPTDDERVRFPLQVDLHQVTGIESPGIKHWLGFIRAVSARGPVTLTQCPPVMTRTFSLIYGATASAQVESVLAPYRCTICRHEDLRELQVGVDLDPQNYEAAPAHRTCERCGGIAEFDELPEAYFSFLAMSRPTAN
jgi:hypothetical protein